jgi:tRNA pseudouridine38-40 synthase
VRNSRAVRRLALVVEYDGTRYRGFQAQSKGITVQGTLDETLQGLLGKYVKTQGAGRTDAGAHAHGQVVAFNTEAEYTEDVYLRALNASLPLDIRVRGAAQVSPEFDPRRHAQSRLYRYLVLNQPVASALWARYAHHVPVPLDVDAMQRAAQALVGTRDYRIFCGASRFNGRDTVRTMFRVSVWRSGALVGVDMEANAFLPQQARRIAGTLTRVGRGKLDEAEVGALLDGTSSESSGPTLSAHGLYLMQVLYKDGILDISGPAGQDYLRTDSLSVYGSER